jgi:uncharacterized protein YhjY with autotransporter beta-barrel domain
MQIAPAGNETLQVNGVITNLSSHNMSLNLPTLAGASATYAGGSAGGSLNFGTGLDLQTFNVTMTGTVNVTGALNGTTSTLIVGDGTITSAVLLAGSNHASYFGGITINHNGTLQLGDGGTSGDPGTTTSIVNNGTLIVDRSDPVTDGGLVVSGTGSFVQAGSGTFTITAADTFSGTTSVTGGGMLNLSNSLALQNSTLITGGTGIVFDSSVGSHAFTLGGLSGSTDLALQDNAGTPNPVALTVGKNNASTTYSGVLSAGGSLIKVGTGTFIVTGNSTYTGTTTITAGTLQFGSGGASGRPGSGNIIDNASLVINRSDAVTDNTSVISGSGSVTQVGTGSLTILTQNTYTGGTIVSAGALIAGVSNVGTTSGAFGATNGTTTGLVTLGNAATTTNNSSPTLLINGAFTVANPITVANQATTGVYTIGGSNASGTATYTGNITLNKPVTLIAATGGTVDFNTGTWTTGNNAITIGSTGNTGIVELDHALATTGGIAVTFGTLALDAAFTGNATVASGATLSGNGSVSGTTGVTSGTINGTGLTLSGVTTFNSTGNTLSGTVTSTNGVTLASGAALADNGALTGNLTVGNGTLTGNGSVSGTTSVTGGTINGAGLTLTGATTFNGAANTLSGTETATGGVTVAAGASVTQSGTLTGNVSLTNGASTTFTGSGTVGTVTLNGGGDTLTGNATLTTSGVTVNGSTNTISGIVIGAITQNASSALTVSGTAGSDALASGATLSGSGTGSVTTLTLAGGNTLSGPLTTTGITVNGTTNSTISGTVTGAITQNASSVLTVSGTAGSDALASGATLKGSGTGSVTTVTLAGGNTVSGPLTTTGITVNGTGNTIGTGTVSGAIIQNASSALTVSGTAGSDALASGATLSGSGTGSVTTVTLAGGNTLSGPLTTTGITVSGLGNSISSGTVSGPITFSGTSALSVLGTASGTVAVGNNATLSGTGTTGAVTLSSAGAINLVDNQIGTLTVGGLTTTGGGLTFEIGTSLGSIDKVADSVSGSLTIGSGTTITVANLNNAGSQTLVNGTYTLLTYSGAATGLGNLVLSTTFLDGHTLSLVDVAGAVELNVTTPAASYSLTASALNPRIMFNTGSTTITSTITNTGAVGTINPYTGLNATITGTPPTGAALGAPTTLPKSGGPLAPGGGTDSGTTTLTAGSGTGAVTITPTVTSVTDSASGSPAVTTNSTTVDIVANRTENATLVNLGRSMVNQTTGSVNTTISSVTGQDASLTRITLAAGPQVATGVSNGTVTVTNGTAYTFGGANDAVNSTTAGVTGNFTTAGNQSGTAVITPTGEGLAGEVVNTIGIAYTADAVNNRTESATSVNLGRILVGSTTGSQTTTISSVTNEDDLFTRITLAAGSQVATGVSNGTITLGSGTAYQFGGANDATNSTTRGVTGSFTTAGTQSGTAVITPTGEGLTGESVNPISIGYTVDPVTKRVIINGAVTDLGTLHSGATVSATAANPFTSTGTVDTTTSVSVAGGTGAADFNGVTLTGGTTTFNGSTASTVDGATQTFAGIITSASGGTTTGSFNLAVTTLETGLGDTYAPVVVAYTANVYTGQGVWNTNGGGSWSTVANWTANGGVPGLDPGFLDTDTATFGNVLTSGTATVTLDGVSPSLKAITFNNTLGASYTIAQGTGGTLKLNNGAGTATITDTAGNHAISAPMELDSNVAAIVANAYTLTLSGAISETGGAKSLSVSGPGTVVLSGINSYSGGTTLSSGRLAVTGSGTLGAATGLLAISGGTLDLGGTSQTVGAVGVTGASTIQNGTLTGSSYAFSAPSGTVAVSANLAGAGALTQSGASTLVLTGANTFSGGTTVSAGTLVAGHASALGTGDVTLSGSGKLMTDNTNHTIAVGGNYSQTGGTLTINLNAATGNVPNAANLNAANDVVTVGGGASLGGTLNLKFNFVPTKGDLFTILETGTGISGDFSSVTVNPAGYQVTEELFNSGNDLNIDVTRVNLQLSTIPGITLTPNEANLAFYLANPNLATFDPALFNAFQTLITAGSPQAITAALDQLTPEKFGNFVRFNIINNAAFSTQMLDSYLAGQRSPQGDFIVGNGQLDSSGLTIINPNMDPGLAQVSSRLLAWSPAPLSHGMLSDTSDPVIAGIDTKEMKSAAAPNGGNPFSVFVMGNVVLAQDFSQADLAHADTTTGAVQVGADYRITPHLRVGALFGYGHTDATLDDLGSKAKVDSYAPGVYASYAQDGWYANALGSYGFNSFTEDRNVNFGGLTGTAHGTPNGNQIVGNLDGGYDFHVKQLTFGPLAGVQYTNLSVDSFTENGSDPVDLQVDKEKADSLRSRLGGHMSYAFQTTGKVVLTPHLDAMWQHEFMDQSRGITSQFSSVGGGSFIVNTPNPSRDSALVDCGLTVDLNGQISIFSDYLVQAGQSNYFGQSVEAGIKIGF